MAFLTQFPTRPIVQGWDPELHATGRIHAAAFLVNSTWIVGGVAYGYAHQPDAPATIANTGKLLAEVSKQVFHGFKGPAFIAGDFNQVEGVLSETTIWERNGWKEIQSLAAERFGVSPGVTCQFTSRKDFIYLSPELQMILRTCSNSFDRWPDHSTLMGLFSAPSPPKPVPQWPKPMALDYTDLGTEDIASTPCASAPVASNPTEQYRLICATFENHVHQCRTAKGLSGLHPRQRGRGQTTSRIHRTPHVVPIKKARQGDCNPSVQTWSLLHSRWITQARRLESYVRHVTKKFTHCYSSHP